MLFSIIFTTTFLTGNHLYATFASPMASKGDVAAGQSLNLTQSLAKRVYSPPDTLCRPTIGWVQRQCLDIVDDLTWVDTCLGLDAYLHPYVYVTFGFCPIGKICMNTFAPSGSPGGPPLVRVIFCMDRPSIFTNSIPGLQTGVTMVTSTNSLHTNIEVPLVNSISAASVSAVLEGTY